MGQDLPTTYWPLPAFIKWMIADLGKMLRVSTFRSLELGEEVVEVRGRRRRRVSFRLLCSFSPSFVLTSALTLFL